MNKCCRPSANKAETCIDLVLELIDARAPTITRAPQFTDTIPRTAARWTVLTKADLADPTVTAHWLNWFHDRLEPVFVMKNQLINRQFWLRQLWKLKQKRHQNIMRVLVKGMANVGKSTLINRLIGRRKAITGNQPGITKHNCWFRVNNWLKIMDTCGYNYRPVSGRELSTQTIILVWIKTLSYHWVELDPVCWSGLRFLITYYPREFVNYFQLIDPDAVKTWSETDLLLWAERQRLMNSNDNQLQIRFLNDLSRGRLGLISFEQLKE